MEAVIRISGTEFDEQLFASIRSFIKNSEETEVTITIGNRRNENLLEEAQAAYLNKIDRSAREIEEGKGVVFTMKEFEEYVNKNFPG